MNLIIKNVTKERATEIVNQLDSLIDQKIILDWTIDETEDQDYRMLDLQFGEAISIKPYYRNQSLCFSLFGNAENNIKYANIVKFSETLLNYFSEDIKVMKIINL